MSSAGSYGAGGGGGVGNVKFLEGNTGGAVGPTLAGIINVVGSGDVTVTGNAGTNTLTISLTGGVATTYDADTGTATPILGILNINGASGIQTTASGNTIIIELSGAGIVESIVGDTGGGPISGALTITGGTSGASFDTTGTTITESFNYLNMPYTNVGGTQGVIKFGGTSIFGFYGGAGKFNTFLGDTSGNFSLTGTNNTAYGPATLTSVTSGFANVGIGPLALTSCTTGNDNIAIGLDALQHLTSGTSNVAVGNQPLQSLLTGGNNVVFGISAGSAYTSSESSNILISNSGVISESNIIRIGTQGSGSGQQNTAYMAGITGSAVGGTNAIVYCDNTGKLGTTGGTFPSLGTTNHAVQVGNAGGGLTSLTVGTTGQVLIGSTGANPAFGALGLNSGLTAHGVLLGENNSALVATAAGTNGQVLIGSTGADPAFATLTSSGATLTYTTGAATLNIDVTAPLNIAHGGTNATSMTNTDGVVYYDGTKLNTTTVGTAGQVLTSNGAAVAPTFQAGTAIPLGTTNHAVQVGNAGGTLTSLAVGTNGQVLVGSTGTDPIFATLGSSGGSITYTTGAGTLNLDLTSPVSIAHGGTNATSMTTTDGVVYYDGTRLVTTAVGTAAQVLTSNGAGVAPTFQSAAGGGVTSITGDTGGAITGALNITGGSSGALFNTSASNITESFHFLAMSDSTSTTGYIQIGTQKVLNCYGGVANNNIFVGQGAGHTTVSGTDNDALGALALAGVTSGAFNIAIGSSALQGTTSSSSNVAIGLNVLGSLTTGSGNNTAIGFVALGNLTTGDNNIAIGSTAGDGYTTTETSNVAIAAQGTAGESHVIRIGTQGSGAGQQNTCFIAGIAGTTVTSTAAVLVNTSTGQLGTIISSRRFKENIDDMGAISRDLHKLRPVKFNLKGDFTESYGLIAEDVEEVMPYLVSYDKEGLPCTVKYHELPVLLLNEIQRLKLKIDELEGKFNARIRP